MDGRIDKLTNLLAANNLALFCLHGAGTRIRLQILHETVCLFDGDLRQLAIAVEDVEDVTLGDSFRTQVACVTCRVSESKADRSREDVEQGGMKQVEQGGIK